jgi:division protein CdvB (Snf7/Vps24/ESCRT-III family)
MNEKIMQEINKTIDDIVEINQLLNEMITLDFESITNGDLLQMKKALDKLNHKIKGIINILDSEIEHM